MNSRGAQGLSTVRRRPTKDMSREVRSEKSQSQKFGEVPKPKGFVAQKIEGKPRSERSQKPKDLQPKRSKESPARRGPKTKKPGKSKRARRSPFRLKIPELCSPRPRSKGSSAPRTTARSQRRCPLTIEGSSEPRQCQRQGDGVPAQRRGVCQMTPGA